MSGISRKRAMVSSLRYWTCCSWSARLLKTSLNENISSGVKHLSANLWAWTSQEIRESDIPETPMVETHQFLCELLVRRRPGGSRALLTHGQMPAHAGLWHWGNPSKTPRLAGGHHRAYTSYLLRLLWCGT